MFYINYDKETGEIVSYQNGGATTGRVGDGTDNECPDDIKATKQASARSFDTLTFNTEVKGLIDEHGRTLLKVDVTTGKLAQKNVVELPEPVKNPDNAARG